MSCDGGHLEFPIGKKNPQNCVEVYPFIILSKFQFNWSSGFRGDLENFIQSEHIISPGGHALNSIRKKNFVETHLRNIPAKLVPNGPMVSEEKIEMFTTDEDDGR